MEKLDTSNRMFSLAADLVNLTSRNIFLTGKAGTGKTSFLRFIRETCTKKMVVVAPTGVAAINAGGVTIHSFFQLPFSPFIPGSRGFNNSDSEVSDKHSLLSRLKLNSERKKIIQELELLVIDEISMVRCDVLDSIDLVLRHVRHKTGESFGGVQVLLIGDMFQLPPVVKEQEWRLLTEFYSSPYFFDSLVLKEDGPLYIEFTKIYRQTEEKFINLLNRVRNNNMDPGTLEELHERFDPDFFSGGTEGYILLTTHNEIARNMNSSELDKLPGRLFSYKAEVENDFPPNAYPADETLSLKVGAQVMFIKNDVEKARRYFNGKIGVIEELDNETIKVKCKDDDIDIEVKREKWENIRYTLNNTTRQLDEDVLGTFNQFPLRLAWAITIHKSQGLTFEKAVIDAGEAFAPGQVYVALSRCTSLDGLVLHSKVNAGRFYIDERIVQFSKSVLTADALEVEFEESKKFYQKKVLSGLFDFRSVLNDIDGLKIYLLKAGDSFNSETADWADGLQKKFDTLQEVAVKFQAQLQRLFVSTDDGDGSKGLQERVNAAAKYFLKELRQQIEFVLQSPAVTDSRLHAKEYNEIVKEIFTEIAMKVFLMEGFEAKLDFRDFQTRKKQFVLPRFSVNAYVVANEKKVDLPNPSLYYQLKQLRDSICSKRNLPVYLVANSKTLEEMVTYLPGTLEELEEIVGFGKTKVSSYGKEFLSLIIGYAAENNLSSTIGIKRVEKKPKDRKPKDLKGNETKPGKIDTKAETFKLFEQGLSTSDIATVRKLAVSTIEGHLAYFIQEGLIRIDQLVNREKLVLIEPVIKDQFDKPLTEIKNALGENVSYGEIRFVIASIRNLESSTHVDH